MKAETIHRIRGFYAKPIPRLKWDSQYCSEKLSSKILTQWLLSSTSNSEHLHHLAKVHIEIVNVIQIFSKFKGIFQQDTNILCCIQNGQKTNYLGVSFLIVLRFS